MTNSNLDSMEITQQTCTGLEERHDHQRFNIQKVQNVLLVWLDKNFNGKNEDHQNIATKLRCIINGINIYVDSNQCIEFMKNIEDHKVCMIISGCFEQQIVPRIHSMSQVDSIFILYDNNKHHEDWIQEWPKIKGVFTEITSMCEAIKQAVQQCEQNAVSISFVQPGTILNQLDPSFMYTQILKEIFLTIDFNNDHIKDYIDYCREIFSDNKEELININQLEQNYHKKTPIWWYTYNCFLYSMLNRALRIMDSDMMTRMGFFINDLHRHIERLHKEQCITQIFTVYRGQGLSMIDFEQLMQTKDGLISFNSFLSTTKIPEVSLTFAQQAAENSNSVGILFVMRIDPNQSTTPFACVHGISYFPNEDEVLFSMHSMFRIDGIKLMNENNRLYEVNLTLTSDNDKELVALTDRIREESFPDNEGWYRLGLVLIQMGHNNKAEEVYDKLLEQTINESDKASIYGQLGWIKYNQKQYHKALILYENSIFIKQKILPPNHPVLASSYNNIGNVHDILNDYPKALIFYEKALTIQQQSLPPDHPVLGITFNNIGEMYRKMDDYSNALLSHEKALAIKQQSLPSNHPSLAASYNNIGLMYENMNNYSKACSFFEHAIQIGQQSLPSNHPELLKCKKHLERVKTKL
ncbi:hypothetical protein I4U23_002032 [Adineta vaga]|nr:hypothetical protein I4U23_002032 [Adineta vaga]